MYSLGLVHVLCDDNSASELLYVADLVVIAETEDDLIKRLNE